MTQLRDLITFPLWPVVNGRCSCNNDGCTDLGKHPAVAWSTVTQATHISPEDIDPGEAYGIPTGPKNHLFVVDCDSEAAIAWFEGRLEEDNLVTKKVTTGKGAHYYFSWIEGVHIGNSQSALFKGIDIRGDGGYVVGPGSYHASGVRYMDNGEHISEPPAWLVASIRGLKKDQSQEGKPVKDIVGLEDRLPLKGMSLKKAIQTAYESPPSISGQNGHLALWKLALKLVKTFRVPMDQGVEIIEKHFNGRCVPPWSDYDIRKKLRDAHEQGRDFIDVGALPTMSRKFSGTVDIGSYETESPQDYEWQVGGGTFMDDKKLTQLNMDQLISLFMSHVDWENVFAWNDFTQKPATKRRPPVKLDVHQSGNVTDHDITVVQAWLNASGFAGGPADIDRAISVSARARRFNPVLDYLGSLPQPDMTILNNLAHRLFGDASDAAQIFLTKFLISAVARAHVPGAKVDTMLVLVGSQGTGKSSFVRDLFKGFSRAGIPDIATKDAQDFLQGVWCVEWEELAIMKRADAEKVKSFISMEADTYRAAYARKKETYPRTCVFIGTTNQPEFITDPTGGRRFWPIRVSKAVDLEFLATNLDEIWSAAQALYLSGERHYLDEGQTTLAQGVQKDHSTVSEVESILTEHVRELLKLEETSTVDVWNKFLKDYGLKMTAHVLMHVKMFMTEKLGFQYVRGKNTRKLIKSITFAEKISLAQQE